MPTGIRPLAEAIWDFVLLALRSGLAKASSPAVTFFLEANFLSIMC